ncbi:MAG: hypothetical protein KGO03_14490 [Gemmatimonadota bacterium]|nr:hypothetical protein [Gemmatimonadota bacterium]
MTTRLRDFGRAGAALAVVGAALVAACSSGPSKEQVRQEQIEAAKAVTQTACPPDGLWKECSLVERLLQAGLVVRRDSAPAHETGVPIAGVLYHLGSLASLEVFYFPDSAARRAAAAKMDTTPFVHYDQPQSVKGERSLIQNANVLALLDSRRDESRERIGDAITAGAPQAPRAR